MRFDYLEGVAREGLHVGILRAGGSFAIFRGLLFGRARLNAATPTTKGVNLIDDVS
jgi:hypothetical protein